MSFTKALITGASSGIGKALSLLVDQKGIDLIAVGRDKKKLQDLQKKYTHCFFPVVADLATKEGQSLVCQVIQEQCPDLVVNNAGCGLYGEAAELDVTEQLKVLHLNSEAVAILTLETIKVWQQRKTKGCILNVSSVAGCFTSSPLMSMYAASKAFVNVFSESIREELANTGISVLVACPGQVDTNFRKVASKGKDQEESKHLSMSVDFVAEQLWKQIETKHPMHVFDYRYRFMLWASRYFVPQKIISKLIKKGIQTRI